MSGSDAGENGSRDPESTEELQAKIEQTRSDLAETVDALSAKADVKGRAAAKAQEVKGRVRDVATDDQGQVRPEISYGGAAVVVLVLGVVVLVVWRRRQ